LARLGRDVSIAMVGLGVSLGLVMPETLVDEVGCLPDVVQEFELAAALWSVHRVLAMSESHYQGLDRMALSGGWAPDISNAKCDELEEDSASFAPEDPEAPEPSS
jgi:hypothetical protein